VTGAQYIEAEDVRRTPLRIAVTPLPSLNCALRDAVGAPRNGTPAAWREAIGTHLRQGDYELLAPFVTPGKTLIPDQLLGLTEPPGESFADGIERMMATPIDDLAREVAFSRVATGNADWLDAERDPARWLRRYVAALLRAWKGFAPVWRHARAALDRETERVAMAAVLDAQLELLDGLVDGSSVADGRWRVRCNFDEGRARFREGGLVMTPLVAGQRASIFARTDDIVSLIAYPIRGDLTPKPSQPPAAALEALLGIPRARILRAAGSPTSIGALAEALHAVPSAATHHVVALEAAGLVARDRRGRNVLVRRSARGEALLQLYTRAN
jgi:DNA-binding transcriptional ArsR family regulator